MLLAASIRLPAAGRDTFQHILRQRQNSEHTTAGSLDALRARRQHLEVLCERGVTDIIVLHGDIVLKGGLRTALNAHHNTGADLTIVGTGVDAAQQSTMPRPRVRLCARVQRGGGAGAAGRGQAGAAAA